MAKRKYQFTEAIAQALDYLEVLRKKRLPIDQAFIFGSHAKGNARRWSDIDICVISPKFRNRCHAIDYLWKRRRDEDVERGIEPIGFHPRDFVDEDPLAWEIKSTGVEIWPMNHHKPLRRRRKQHHGQRERDMARR
ncbi:MAG: nucleotidyltransferase domain-containing protein [bacterium]